MHRWYFTIYGIDVYSFVGEDDCNEKPVFNCWQCSSPLCDAHARRSGTPGLVFCNMSHAPTAEEIAAHEAGIGAPIGLAAIEAGQEPLAPPNVEGGQAVEGVQPRGDEEEEHVNILT